MMTVLLCFLGYLLVGFLISLWVVYHGVEHESDVDDMPMVVIGTTLIWPLFPFFAAVQWAARKGIARKKR